MRNPPTSADRCGRFCWDVLCFFFADTSKSNWRQIEYGALLAAQQESQVLDDSFLDRAGVQHRVLLWTSPQKLGTWTVYENEQQFLRSVAVITLSALSCPQSESSTLNCCSYSNHGGQGHKSIQFRDLDK